MRPVRVLVIAMIATVFCGTPAANARRLKTTAADDIVVVDSDGNFIGYYLNSVNPASIPAGFFVQNPPITFPNLTAPNTPSDLTPPEGALVSINGLPTVFLMSSQGFLNISPDGVGFTLFFTTSNCTGQAFVTAQLYQSFNTQRPSMAPVALVAANTAYSVDLTATQTLTEKSFQPVLSTGPGGCSNQSFSLPLAPVTTSSLSRFVPPFRVSFPGLTTKRRR